MRGKGKLHLQKMKWHRITPAYAGKSFFVDGSYQLVGDHPRVCGEKLQTSAVFGSALGSPPRMRGKAARLQLQELCQRITPAYAGKSRPCNHTGGLL